MDGELSGGEDGLDSGDIAFAYGGGEGFVFGGAGADEGGCATVHDLDDVHELCPGFAAVRLGEGVLGVREGLAGVFPGEALGLLFEVLGRGVDGEAVLPVWQWRHGSPFLVSRCPQVREEKVWM